jgi:hypothetical protein
LAGVAATIDGGGANGSLQLLSSGVPVSTISLARGPCATASGGVLKFLGTLLDPSAAGTGNVNGAVIKDSNGVAVVSGLIVSSNIFVNPDILISTAAIVAGQTIQILSATITGE